MTVPGSPWYEIDPPYFSNTNFERVFYQAALGLTADQAHSLSIDTMKQQYIDMGGIKGSQGPQGIPGAQGPKGDQGIQGPAGPSGSVSGLPTVLNTGSASVVPSTRIDHRIDSAANWSSSNPVLRQGEIGFETPVGGFSKFKIGDGTTQWSTLPYFTIDLTSVNAAITAAQTTATAASASATALTTAVGNVDPALPSLAQQVADLTALVQTLLPPPVGQVSWVQLQIAQPAPPPSGGSFPGDPGVGKAYIGTCSANSSMSRQTFDQLIWGPTGIGSTATGISKTRRVYFQDFNGSGERTLMTTILSEGRIVLTSMPRGAYTLADIAALTAPVKADLDNLFSFIAGSTGVFWITPGVHEPTANNKVPVGTSVNGSVNYRKSGRAIIDYCKTNWPAAAAKIAWCGAMHVSPQDFTTQDWKEFSPERNDTNTDWIKNGAGVRTQYVDIMYVDSYWPTVAVSKWNSTTRTPTFTSRWINTIVKQYQQDGGRDVPWGIAELGIANLAAFQFDGPPDNVSATMLLNDFVEKGVKNYRIVDLNLWINDSFSFVKDNGDPVLLAGDTYGEKANALRNIVQGKVLRDTTGAVVTGSTPKANYRWVADVNRIVSA